MRFQVILDTRGTTLTTYHPPGSTITIEFQYHGTALHSYMYFEKFQALVVVSLLLRSLHELSCDARSHDDRTIGVV